MPSGAVQELRFGFWVGLGFALAALLLGILESVIHGRFRRG